MKHLQVKVSGKVQGVFFRAETKKKAEEIGVTGFVRNEEDGTVYIEAEGEESLLEQFLKWCHEGPTLAEVEDLSFDYEDSLKQFTDFEIRA
jgi:acylphosphatase